MAAGRDGWTVQDVQGLYRMDAKTRQTLIKAENEKRIPQAERIKRGRVEVRQWRADQLPMIGARYGFLRPPKSTRVICVYTAKGGVLKSTLSYTLGRLLALNGISVLLVGLDIQGSITDLALPPLEAENIEDSKTYLGLADLFAKTATLDEIIYDTDLPTLDVIPETPALGVLEKQLRDRPKREQWLTANIVEKLKKQYQVILFDNSPNWNLLIENALTAANVVLSPIGCDLGSFHALETNLVSTRDFGAAMELDWDTFLLVPTLYEKNKLSTQILGAYMQQYADTVTPHSIRRAIRGQEALATRRTPLEADPKSELSNDYYDLVKDIWARILKSAK